MLNQGTTIILMTLLCTLSFGGMRGLSPHPQQDMDYTQELKAVFIYNFTKYMNWMDSEPSSTFDIAVVGDSQIAEPLRLVAQKRRVNQKDIHIKLFKDPDQIDQCHILFIPESKKKQLNRIIDNIQDKNTLVISEIEGALSSGVMINFLIVEDRIKFEINLKSMKKSGFQPSSELLKLAVRIIE